MNLFEIDYFDSTLALLKESFKFKKYKAMHPAFAIVTGLALLPFVILSFFIACSLLVTCFFFKVLTAPIGYLHGLLHKEGQEVKHGTQVIVYWISWPIVFALYTLVSILLVFITVQYAALSILCYIWTLGGFKGHIFPSTEKSIEIEVTGKYKVLPVVFTCIFAGLCLIAFVDAIATYIDLYSNYRENYFSLTTVLSPYVAISTLFSALYSLIGYARHPEVKAPAVVAEADASEE